MIPARRSRIAKRVTVQCEIFDDLRSRVTSAVVLHYFSATGGTVNRPKGIYGNSGRNIINGPSFNNTDFTLMKDMRLREPLKVQLRGEFFNAFNQVHFDPPNVTVSSGSFGRILSAQPGRVVQVALKFIW